MRILITNDDGINAPGLEVLEKIARALSDDVWVVAPETEQSGAGHSLTLHTPVRVRKITPKRYAVLGTPTDCVLLALKQIIPAKQKVTLILSGVNRGSNAGDDVTYSGTIAAAMEGCILGVPSVALSLLYEDPEKIQWQTAEKHAPGIIKTLLKKPWPKDTLINLNFPDCTASKVKGVKVCAQGKRVMNIKLGERVDPKGRPYYWLGGERDNTPEKPNVDLDFLSKGFITVTPIGMDMTDYQTLSVLDKIF
ncbi:MAG: 5'/3'-nucleotidase SurE [Alphaproteobacteria bacterium]|nr:5'/3'-nucleotidase SurE [Alphaproteobacteria bacterium]